MGVEIERKFLVATGWLPPTPGVRYVQGYLHSGGEGATVRVRVAGDKAWLTIKGASEGAKRLEFEYAIPPAEGSELLEKLGRGHLVEKSRHLVPHAGHTWEVDVFTGENAGLVVAEVELAAEDEAVEIPEWAVAEVTGDHRYANSWLSIHPYKEWASKGEGT